MALQVVWQDPTTQVTASAAYARVVSIHVDANAQTIDLAVGLYATALARNTLDAPPFTVFHAWPDYAEFLGTPVDVRAAAYAFLKTLPPFAQSADV